MTHRLNALYMFITRGCNLRCRHCYIGALHQSGEQHQPAIDAGLFRDVVRQAKRLGVSYVKLGGGEVDAFAEIGAGFEGEIHRAARAALKGCCSGCVVPNGIYKAIQIAAGLALPRPVAISLDRTEE